MLNSLFVQVTKSASVAGTTRMNRDLFRVPFSVIDIEATGGNPNTDRIIEIAVFIVQNLEIQKHYHRLVNPGLPVPPFISKLTGINNSILRDRPPIERVLSSLIDFLDGTTLVAHNANFDAQFLRNVCAEHLGVETSNGVLCTRKLSKRLFPWLPGYSLDTIAEFFGIEIRDRHRAYGDALATVDILNKIIRYLDFRGVRNLEQVYMIENGRLRLA